MGYNRPPETRSIGDDSGTSNRAQWPRRGAGRGSGAWDGDTRAETSGHRTVARSRRAGSRNNPESVCCSSKISHTSGELKGNWRTRIYNLSPPIRSLFRGFTMAAARGDPRRGSADRSRQPGAARQTRNIGVVLLVGRAARAWCRDGGETTGFLPPHSI